MNPLGCFSTLCQKLSLKIKRTNKNLCIYIQYALILMEWMTRGKVQSTTSYHFLSSHKLGLLATFITSQNLSDKHKGTKRTQFCHTETKHLLLTHSAPSEWGLLCLLRGNEQHKHKEWWLRSLSTVGPVLVTATIGSPYFVPLNLKLLALICLIYHSLKKYS